MSQFTPTAQKNAPGRRRIARAWGVVYINDDGSVDEETTPVTPPPAP